MVQPGPFDTTLSPVDQQYVVMPNGNCFFEFLPVQQHQDDDDAGGGIPGIQDSLPSAARGQPVLAACAVAAPDVQQDQQQQDVKAGDPQLPKCVTMDGLVVGQEYELVVSTFCGLTR